MTTLNEIQKFLAPKKMAIAGASRNEKKFGGYIFKDLTQKGFELYPVNPNTEEIQGVKCYKTVSELPEDVKLLYVVTPKSETLNVVNEAVKKGMEMIWIQQKAETLEAVEAVRKAGTPLIYDKCMLMFAEPVKGIHGFHRFVAKTFGGYPKAEK